MKIEEKIAILGIKPESSSHIELDPSICRECVLKICIRACPAHLYECDDKSELVRVEHSGCLECGTCMLICPKGAVRWRYPSSGYGISYRYG